MTAKEVVARLKRDGWYEVRRQGSHAHFAHSDLPGIVTVPMHAGHDLPKGTLANIRRQAHWS